MSNKARIFAIGDVAVNREQPDTIFELVRDRIQEADYAFTQIEAIYSKLGEVNVSGTSSPLRGDPENVAAIGRAGFNMASFASNHCLDYGISAFQDTIKHFRAMPGMHLFGAGDNLAEARKPVIVEHNGNRIGWLAYCSILPIRYWADVDRPGCAPARARTIYETMEPDQPGSAQATPHGQIVFFTEFLATAGVFDRWVQACPLHYSSPNASRTRDVLGTLMLGILAGSKRYAHIAGTRGDAVAAKALGLQGMVSEDSVRRALKAMEPAASEPWMRGALMASVRDALDRPWVLDLDATIKPLYGRQEGADLGYNPHKPGRPSHVLHTFWIGNLRLVLDAVLSSGKQNTSGHAKAAMGRLD